MNRAVIILTQFILIYGCLFLFGSAHAINPDDVFWDSRFDSLGVSHGVYSISVSENGIYVGGQFTSVGGLAAERIAKWDGSSWSALGAGIVGWGVWVIATSGTDVYAGGGFSSAGGSGANSIARWDGSSWHALGSGITDAHTTPAVHAIAIDGGDVYVGGCFDKAGGVVVNSIAKWDGSSWSSLGSGLYLPTVPPHASGIAVGNGYVYVGGDFTEAGGVPAQGFAKWDGSNWSPVTAFRGYMEVMVMSGTDIYVGGLFNFGSPSGTLNNVAKWNGSSWSTMGGGTNGEVYGISVIGNDVYAAGDFTSAGGVAVKNVAKWDGSNWSPLGNGIWSSGGSNDRAFAVAVDSDSAVYVGGYFDYAGYKVSRKFARWYKPAAGGPNISIVPDSLADSLLSGEMSTDTLTISNTGGIESSWRLAIGRSLFGDLTGVRIMWARAHGQGSTDGYSTIIDSLSARGATVTEDFREPQRSVLDEYDIYWTIEMTSGWSSAEITALQEWLLDGGSILLEADEQPTIGSFNDLLNGMNAGINYSGLANTAFYATDIFPHVTTTDVDSIYYFSVNAQFNSVHNPAGPLVNYPVGSTGAAYCARGRGRLVALADETFYNPEIAGVASDNQLFGRQVFDWLAGAATWAGGAPAWGTLAAGDSVEVVITLDATGLIDGDHDAEIQVYSDDFDNSVVSVPVQLHVTGIPDIAVSDTVMDFGVIALGDSTSDTLIVSNVGTDTLSVNDISVDHMDYSVDTTHFSLIPGANQSVVIGFAPGSLGIKLGTLTILSDDPDEDTLLVSLEGRGAGPPEIVVSPDSLSEELYTGEVSIQTLTIENTGEGLPLDWSIGDLAGIRIMYTRANGQAPLANCEGFLDSLALRGATVTEDFRPIDLAVLSEYEILWARDMSSTWSSDERAAIQSWIVLGGDLIIEADEYPTITTCNNLLTALNAGILCDDMTMVVGYTDDIYPHETTTGIDSLHFRGAHARLSTVESPAGLLVRYADGNNHAAYSEVGNGRIIALTDEMIYNRGLDGIDSDNYIFGHRIFGWVAGSTTWLSTSPTSGSVPMDSSVSVNVEFDARYLDGGDYNGEINILSNALNDTMVTIPVFLRVTATPDIDLSDTSINYGLFFVGQTVHKNLTIFNLGNDTLRISNITVDYAAFSVDTTVLNIAPGENFDLTVSFTPIIQGIIMGELTIFSNDYDEGTVVVSLLGGGMLPPDIVVSPYSVAEVLLPGEASKKTVRIANPGTFDLYLNINVFSAPDSGISCIATDIMKERRDPVPSRQSPVSHKKSIEFSDGVSPADKGQPLKPYETGGISRFVLNPNTDISTSSLEILVDHFEDGDYAGWEDGGGASSKEVTNYTAANGTFFSYHEYNSSFGHFNGIYRELGIVQPGHISFWVRSDDAAAFDSYFVLRDSAAREVIWFFASASGSFYINVDVGGHGSYAYENETWYHIEFADINFVEKTFDYYVNKELIQENIPFRNAEQVDHFYRLDLYNYSAGSSTWFDEIDISGWLPVDWLSALPYSGVIHSDSSVDIALTFDAGDLGVGGYDGVVRIHTNVPSKRFLLVPVHLDVDSSLTRTLTFPLVQGWNLLSWNVDTPNDSIVSLLAQITDHLTVAHGFDSAGLTYAPGIPPEFNTLISIDHFSGCWLKMNGPDTMTVEGPAVKTQEPILLDTGYNLISYLPNIRDSVANAIESVVDNTEHVLGYDGTLLLYDPSGDPGSNTLHFMERGRGYWLKMTVDDTLMYPRLPAVPPPPLSMSFETKAREAAPEVIPTTEWISAWGDSVLWGGKLLEAGTIIHAVDEDSVVCGAFTVTIEGQFGLMPIYRDDPYTTEDEGADPGEIVRLSFDDVTGSRYLIWTENGAVFDYDTVATDVRDLIKPIPTVYRLFQNYPNPFNPTTTIQYELPEATVVRLNIYNVKGELVRRLVNRKQPPERYKIQWDGRNESGQMVSSGVYFYRLVAKGFTQTKKMVFLK